MTLGRWELTAAGSLPLHAEPADTRSHCLACAYLMELHLSPRIFSKQFAQGTSSSWHKISSAPTAALHLKQQ